MSRHLASTLRAGCFGLSENERDSAACCLQRPSLVVVLKRDAIEVRLFELRQAFERDAVDRDLGALVEIHAQVDGAVGLEHATEAERCLRHAVAIAAEQGAKSFELRAATSLARLLRNTGRRDEARVMLADIYNWFTEGFDTADLKAAKALLGELGA